MDKFWNWIRDATDGRVLRFEGPIDSEAFWGDEITPAMFRRELEAEDGDVTVWLNSPGGNVFAAAEIYTMLRDYKGAVTVKIASLAASAASVVAMAGDEVLMSPTALLMIHDPATIAVGNTQAMEQAIATLNEVKESIINAYATKTGLSRKKIADLMAAETWINAKKAVELGFADAILFAKDDPEEEEPEEEPEDPEEAPEETTPEEEPAEEPAEEPEEEPRKRRPVPGAQLYQQRMTVAAVLNSINAKPESTTVIGMDGKTKEGAMPYEILRNQLEMMR